MRRSFLHLLGGVLFGLPLLFASCGNSDNALEEIIKNGGSAGGSDEVSVTGISLNKTTLTIKVGEDDVTLTAIVEPDNATDKTITWSSDKEAVATVDETGKVHAVSGGTAIITAKAGDMTATCTVTVPYIVKEYNKGTWDATEKKVVFTKETAPVEPTAITSSTTSWSGWVTVSGNVEITNEVTLNGDTHLILQDGAQLTITGRIKGLDHVLYIYGQAESTGKLDVTYNTAGSPAIYSHTIMIHGGMITAENTTTNCGLNVSRFEMYGGKLKATSGGNDGINIATSFDVYGGEVEATSNNAGGFGIYSGDNTILTVYGGKLKAIGGGSGGHAIKDNVKIKSGIEGIKFYFADTEDGLATAAGKAYDGSGTGDMATPAKQYAKAE